MLERNFLKELVKAQGGGACVSLEGGYAPQLFSQTDTDIFSFHAPTLPSVCPSIPSIIPPTECKEVKRACLQDVKA